jgi:tRNA dimethylallyltransferase
MIHLGFVEEVRKLWGRFPKHCHAFKAIGYRQIADHLEGLTSLEEAIADTKLKCRHYAKRQLTWFRADRDIIWLDGGNGEDELVEQSSELIARFLEVS